MREAMFWNGEGEGYVRCTLCPHHCRIAPGGKGICHVRENRDGILYSLNYARIVASNIDPIEKSRCITIYPGVKAFRWPQLGAICIAVIARTPPSRRWKGMPREKM